MEIKLCVTFYKKISITNVQKMFYKNLFFVAALAV